MAVAAFVNWRSKVEPEPDKPSTDSNLENEAAQQSPMDSDLENEAAQQSPTGELKKPALTLLIILIALLAAAGAYIYFNQNLLLSVAATDEHAPMPAAVHKDMKPAARLAKLERQFAQWQDQVPVAINLFWALSETEYFLTSARYKLLVEGDPESALELLQLAGKRLEGLWPQELAQVRQHIDSMVESLIGIGANGVQEALVSINRLQQEMIAAVAQGREQPAEQPPAMQSTNNASDEEQSFWAKLWRDVAALVTIEKRPAGSSIDASRQQQQESHLMRLQLIQLRGAVLHRDDNIFQQLLAELESSTMVQDDDQLQRELDSLASIRLRPLLDTSELDSALESLRAYQRGNN